MDRHSPVTSDSSPERDRQAASRPVRPTVGESSAGGETANEPKVTPKEILAAVSHPIPPRRTTVGYRLGLLLVTCVMIALPLVYLGIIAIVTLAVVYHAVHHIGILTALGVGRRRIGVVLAIYLLPILLGGTVIFFLLKPLLAKKVAVTKPRSLRREEQPLLFSFIDRLCAAMQVPFPQRIEIDCRVNAAAYLRRGLLSKDLVLIIGAPLAAGLSLRQFAGVLAHEFGHFSQGSAMRITYIIRVINHWLMRLVYQRDNWDMRLQQWVQSGDGSLRAAGWLIKKFVWLTRKLLTLLLYAGNAVAGYLLREMEYDADRCELLLAGSYEFSRTSRRMQELNAGNAIALDEINLNLTEGRLADNLPAYLVARTDQLPLPIQKAISQHLKEERSGLFDTHPSDAERIANAQQMNAPGTFTIDAPASVLFRDFESLCRLVTWDLYRFHLGDGIDRKLLKPTADLIRRIDQSQEKGKALNSFLLKTYSNLRPLRLPKTEITPPANPKQAVADIKAAREAMLEFAVPYWKTHRKFGTAYGQRFSIDGARVLHRIKAPVKRDTFPIDLTNMDKVLAEEGKLKRIEQACLREMRPFEAAVISRLCGCIDLLGVPKVITRFEHGPHVVVEVNRLLAALNVLSEQLAKILPYERTRDDILTLFRLWPENGGSDIHRDAIEEWTLKLQEGVTEIWETLHEVPYPLPHEREAMSIAQNGCSAPPEPGDSQDACESYQNLYSAMRSIYIEAMGRLCELALEVERLLGLPPLPQPEEEGAPEDGEEPV